MTAKQLADHGRKLFGERAWQSKLADALKVDRSTINRYVSGALPVPGPIAVAVQLLAEKNP